MKRVKAFLCSVLLLFASVMSAMPAVHAVGSNLVANPSAETNTNNVPSSWSSDKWGTNTTTFSYLATGHTGSHSLNVKTTAYSSGDAKWYFSPLAASPNTSYTFSDWYQNTAVTSVDVVVTSTSGVDSYLYQGDQAVSSTWKQASYTFTTPANASKITVYHYLQSVGSLTTDDYSLVNNSTPNPGPTAPTVSVSAPTANSSVSGTVNVTANASDAQQVTGVQFQVDGANIGTADTTSPYSASWDSTTASNGPHTITATATNNSGLTTTSSPVNVTASNNTPPVGQPDLVVTNVSWIPATPATGNEVTFSATIKNQGTVSTPANVKHRVAFSVDGIVVNWSDDNLTSLAAGASRTQTANGGPSAKASWTATSGTHTILANVDDSNLITENNETNNTLTASLTPTTPAPTSPTVSVTAPTANASLSGTTTLTATASDAQQVTGVQFQVDGTKVGSALTASPYNYSWDSKTVANGPHTITAVATNNSNLSTTSSPVSVTVSNTVTPPPSAGNLIANPSVEAGSTAPTGWTGDGWGTNTHTTTYENTGHTGSRSLKTTISSYTNGDAKWLFDSVPVTANTTYKYSNWYKSSVDTELDAMVTMTNGSVQYLYLTAAPAASNWTQVSSQFTAPTGAASVTIFQVIAKVGYVQNDDFSMAAYTPAKLNRAVVSLTFDDGWRSIATNGMPLLNKYGYVSTQYLNSQPITGGYPDYMTYQMVKDYAAQGSELAWHTRTHANLTTKSVSAIDTELNIPSAFLTGIGKPASTFQNFATPYGAYNTTVVNEIKKFYGSHRSTDEGYNGADSTDIYNIKVQNILNTTTPAEVQGWVDHAKATNTWLVIVYHEVTTSPASPAYAVTPTNFDQELSGLKQSGVTVETVGQALNEIKPQLQ